RRLAEYVSMAFRIATTGLPGPVYLEMPIDQLFNTYDDSRLVFPTQYRTDAGTAGDPRYVERAFELLRTAQRPVALVGSQLRWSTSTVVKSVATGRLMWASSATPALSWSSSSALPSRRASARPW